ncbi:MAG TPA: S4 domain-containing protein, partial [Patescibacteria group bacterium]|nr:S4 domain-containing protein [Patescibacteria group bacterium]
MDFIVTQDQAKTRLDKFLTQNLTNQTRSQIKKLIKSGSVLINNKPVKVHQFLRTGDKIEIKNQRSEIKEIKENLTPKTYNLKPNVIFEDSDFLVLEKPSGLLV